MRRAPVFLLVFQSEVFSAFPKENFLTDLAKNITSAGTWGLFRTRRVVSRTLNNNELAAGTMQDVTPASTVSSQMLTPLIMLWEEVQRGNLMGMLILRI